jgi:hypothetical protein
MRQLITVPPGEVDVRSLGVTFWKEIEAGDYTLAATRGFSLDRQNWFELESRVLKVHVK